MGVHIPDTTQPPPSARRKNGRALRVLSIPGRGQTNPFFDLFFDALEPLGAQPVPMSVARLLLLRFDVLHLHFPTHYITLNGRLRAVLSAVFLSTAFILTRLSGRPIVLTVHDVVPLETRHEWLLWPYYGLVRWCVRGYVFLSASSREAFVARFPREARKPWRLARHGPYAVELLSAAERAARHDAIAGPDALVVGVLGKIKPYKNVGAVARMPERLASGRRVFLMVAGPADESDERTVTDALATRSAESYLRRPGPISDRELDLLIQAVDVVALPYESGSNSGAALLVLSNLQRVLGSTLPIFRELAAEPGPPWVQVCDDSLEGWQSALAATAEALPSNEDRAALARYLTAYSFEAGADAVMSLYTELSQCGTEQ